MNRPIGVITYNTNNYITMNGYTIRSKDNLKHLGFFWNNKSNVLSMEDNNIKCRIGKYWSVIKTLVKGGICHPSTIKQLYSSLAVQFN